MDLIRLLVALHPKDWRRRYGEEFSALLEDTRPTPSVVVNVAVHATRARVRAHLEGVLVAAVLVVSVTCHVIALRTGLTRNILWAPTNLPRALALLGTVGPWAALIARRRVRRRAVGA
ncbi:hypothetical protein NGB36_32765 [Streptomyces sp. RB6PN25]|uniref:Uncharacterized protein n=1 Tax=Streptomyces humicola TaxID=2953240 RepID=A0ABT1Q8Q1_9ACTN|nr:hypothetical protein [Streptomyces humicola]MCQ4085205.1 hypothetical protein [Streptomyces humicola]